MKNNKVLVSVINDLVTDQRVHKMCLFIQSQGYEVTLIGRKLKNSLPIQRPYKTKRFKLLFTKGPFFYVFFNIRLFFYLLFKKSNILVSNDLDTLLPNYLVSKIKSIKIVYDSHEYFTEVPELINRPMIQKVWLRIEEFIFPKLKQVITVNTSIQEKFEKKYHVPVLVVRNVSQKITFNQIKSKHELGIPEDKFILIFQGAGININRGAEEITEAMEKLPECCLLFVGNGDVINKIKEIVKTKKLNNVLFFEKMPYEKMMNHTYHADLGLSLDKPINENYVHSLPNKIFDYIHAETPILATNINQVKNIINKHQVGYILEELTVDNLVKTIKNIILDKITYERLKKNCHLAKEIECWENEVQKLNVFYPKIEN